MHDAPTRRGFLGFIAAVLGSATATQVMAQSSGSLPHAGGSRRAGGSSRGHSDGTQTDPHASDEHMDEGHETGASHEEHADSGKGKGPRYQGGAERGETGGHADEGGHEDGGTEHADGRRGPYYRGGRDVSGVTHGRGRSLEDRVLRANGDVDGLF